LINPYIYYEIYGSYLCTKEYPQKQEVINAKQANGKKVLVVYQPSAHTNITEEMAYKIAQGASETGAIVTLIRPSKDAKINSNDFDTIILGSPWYTRPSVKLLEFIQNLNNISNKEIHIFITQGGAEKEDYVFMPFEQALTTKGVKPLTKELYSAEIFEKSLEQALEFGRNIGQK